MTGEAIRPAELAALSDAVTSSATVRVPLDSLLRMWAATAPRLVGRPEALPTLVAGLTTLAEQGALDLPAGAWDRSHVPALPKFVTVASARRAKGVQPWRRFPWNPALGWASSLKSLGPKQFGQLVEVNDWLAATAGKDAPFVPHRFRSAELFGDEKALDVLAKSALFDPGRLSYELLRCTRYASPLPAAIVGDGPDILVVENSDPYWVAVEALRGAPGHPVGAVVWGCGQAFPSQVASLGTDVAGRGPVLGTTWYWGDLDPTGVNIAVAAAEQARTHLVTEVRPALELWSAFSSCDITQPGTCTWTESGRVWLGQRLWDELAAVRTAAGRVPQEAVQPGAVAEWVRTI